MNNEFAPATITVDTGARVTLTMVSEDTEEHNWEVIGVAVTNTCAGPCRASVTFTAPAPGQYRFFCIVHADMGGTLNVR